MKKMLIWMMITIGMVGCTSKEVEECNMTVIVDSISLESISLDSILSMDTVMTDSITVDTVK